MKRIEIEISPVGAVKVETKGFGGKACKSETAEFERMLGTVTSDKPTAEAYRNESNTVVNQH